MSCCCRVCCQKAGAGSSRGFAHIGVLEALTEIGVPIDAIAGSSAGAGIGSVWAMGFPADKIHRRFAELADHAARPTLPLRSLFCGERLRRHLERAAEGHGFADALVPFGAVAADLKAGAPVRLRSGSLVQAVQASCSMPGLYPPVEIDGYPLVAAPGKLVHMHGWFLELVFEGGGFRPRRPAGPRRARGLRQAGRSTAREDATRHTRPPTRTTRDARPSVWTPSITQNKTAGLTGSGHSLAGWPARQGQRRRVAASSSTAGRECRVGERTGRVAIPIPVVRRAVMPTELYYGLPTPSRRSRASRNRSASINSWDSGESRRSCSINSRSASSTAASTRMASDLLCATRCR